MDLLIFAGFKTLHCCLWTVNCCLFCQHWYRDLTLVLVANKLVKLVKTASSHEPSWMGWPGYRDQWIRSISPWVHMRTFSPVSEMRKGRNPGNEFRLPNRPWNAFAVAKNPFLLLFILVTGLKCSYGKIFEPACRDPGWKNRNLGNRASSPLSIGLLWRGPKVLTSELEGKKQMFFFFHL